MDELLEQFLVEGRELVQQATDDLLALERSPGDAGRIASAFRAVHTLKGSVDLFDLAPFSLAMHAAEDLIGAMRDDRLTPSRPTIDVLLECVGATDAWIDALARTGGLPPGAGEQARALAYALRAPLGAAPNPGLPATVDWAPLLVARHASAVTAARNAGQHLTCVRYTPAAGCFFLGDDPLALIRAVPGLVALHVEGRDPWSVGDYDPFACNLVIEALSTAPIDAVRAAFRLVPDQVAVIAAPDDDPAPISATDTASRTLRVDASRVDALVDIVGEMIVAKNGLAHLVARSAASAPAMAKALSASHAEIDRLVGEMHRAVMRARMVPMSQITRRLPRLVRDIASKLGRQVRFDISGADIEADKTIVDGLYEPLLHMLRNAVDHGVEDAEARIGAGKPPVGCVALDVSRDGDQIIVSVKDDGRGIDPAQLRRAAKAHGVTSGSAVDELGDVEVLDLLFTPGFSTASTVSAISGRGVGMDAVRTAVNALGGRAAITSQPGFGTTVQLTLPQAVAITTIITVRLGEERFGVPLDIVAETARIPVQHIVPVHGGVAFVLRDRTIPLLQLTRLLDFPVVARTATHAKILILALGDRYVGVEVDAFEDRSDVLLRPLSGLLAGMPGLLGAALLGDGRLLMVLDLPGLIG